MPGAVTTDSEMERLPFPIPAFSTGSRIGPSGRPQAPGAQESGGQCRDASRDPSASRSVVQAVSLSTARGRSPRRAPHAPPPALRARVHRASLQGGRAWLQGPQPRRRQGRDARGAGRRAGWAGGVGCHPQHTSAGGRGANH